MKKITLTTLMIASFYFMQCQDHLPETIHRNVQHKPEFPGGEDALVGYFSRNIRYPNFAVENRIEGIVDIEFIVNKDGTILDPKVLKGIKGGCDEEALRLVKSLPKWMPGKKNGYAVKTYYNVSIPFKIDF